MAIYHIQVKPVCRASGRSATAAAAYRSGSEIPDLRTGEEFDYTRKQGVEHSEIVLPSDAARHDINWPRDRAALWNAAELAEKRKDARVAREYEVALPAELSAEQRLELTREFAQYLAERHGCAVDIAIHAPHRNGDQRNHHAHLLATTRRIMPTGMGDKTSIEWSDTDRKKRGLPSAAQEIVAIRERWAQMSNEALARHGHEARVDHRTLEAQRAEALQKGDTDKAAELDREPTKHLGVVATALERRGEKTDLGEINRRIAEAAEYGRLEREKQALDRSIVDVSGDLAAALKERDAAQALKKGLQPDGELSAQLRRQAREAWAQMRAAGPQARQTYERGREELGRDGLGSDTRGQAGPEQSHGDMRRGDSTGRDTQGRDRPQRPDLDIDRGFGRAEPGQSRGDGGIPPDLRASLHASLTAWARARLNRGETLDPREGERMLRELMQQHEERQQREREDERVRAEQARLDRARDGRGGDDRGQDGQSWPDRSGPGRQSTYGDPQSQRDREWDRGRDSGRDSGQSSTEQEQQRQRERDIEHRRHRDRGLDR